MDPTPSAQAAVEHVRPEVDAALARHLEVLGAELSALGDAAPLVEQVAAILTGGKRLRAALCYWSWRAHGGDPADAAGRTAAVRTGAALELFQSAALFHDDVMDGSDTRRGRPAAHRTFEALHRSSAWSGPAERFGESAAILLGDLALIACDRELTAAVADLPVPRGGAVRAVFDAMRTEVTVGQYLDVLAQALPWGEDPADDERRAREVIRAKSARYSVEHPLVLGAALADADAEHVDRCRQVGLPLGEAFQLRDDLLGVFGEPAATGKPAGDDLREGKRTVLVARAMGAASPADRALVREHLGRRDLTSDDVAALRDVLHRSGAVEAVEGLIAELSEPALSALAAAPLAEPGRGMLVELGRAAVHRQA
ncbi:polyprenyl synthetase family protein [Actinotalea solisilvae]|uniref:polyprenyl synthetase family protein n=1 Tax=Actinotalea solisilvae TaxID=2072922 RepID=UPI0018F235BD|nr:polyprenyl synthetase family protein [Actinotalea solisilvae]